MCVENFVFVKAVFSAKIKTFSVVHRFIIMVAGKLHLFFVLKLIIANRRYYSRRAK